MNFHSISIFTPVVIANPPPSITMFNPPLTIPLVPDDPADPDVPDDPPPTATYRTLPYNFKMSLAVGAGLSTEIDNVVDATV